MITLYTGTPGSGKSYHALGDIRRALLNKKNVITNVSVDIKKISRNGRRKIGLYKYFDFSDFDIDFLYFHSFERHKKGKEGQTLIVIDECQLVFNARDWQKLQRKEWVSFFTRHRHLGYNVILITQFDRFIDRQIRGLLEYELKHRKVNNFGPFCLLPFTVFIVIEYWYGSKTLVSKHFMMYRRWMGRLYDSYSMYDEFAIKLAAKYAQDKDSVLGMESSPCLPMGGGGGVSGVPHPPPAGWCGGVSFRNAMSFFSRSASSVKIRVFGYASWVKNFFYFRL